MSLFTHSTMSSASVRATAAIFALLSLALRADTGAAQQRPASRTGSTMQLSLDDALRMAQAQSPTVELARSGVTRANGQVLQARSQMLPQMNATAGYGRTLQSQFQGFLAAPAADTTPVQAASKTLCTPALPVNATAAERTAALAQAATCPSTSGGGLDFSKTSFGAKNQYQVSVQFSQNVYTAGRVRAQNDAANAQARSANIDVSSQRAQVSLDVTSAYYDAVLADQLVAIADSSLAETDAVLAQTRVARQVGNSSEYDLLRAQVARDNQVPVRIQAISNRQVAYLHLKQLLNV
ncbi:MAG: TolC family protein, partial [Gemmatimonadaceae bacterium]